MQKAPNSWSCLPAAFAMAADISLTDLLEKIGHSGSKIVFTGKDPRCRRGYHIQEIKLALLYFGFSIMDFYPNLTITPEGIQRYGIDHKCQYERIVKDNTGVFIGLTISGRSHAVAWEAPKMYDPTGKIYSRGIFFEKSFWLTGKINITKK